MLGALGGYSPLRRKLQSECGGRHIPGAPGGQVGSAPLLNQRLMG